MRDAFWVERRVGPAAMLALAVNLAGCAAVAPESDVLAQGVSPNAAPNLVAGAAPAVAPQNDLQAKAQAMLVAPRAAEPSSSPDDDLKMLAQRRGAGPANAGLWRDARAASRPGGDAGQGAWRATHRVEATQRVDVLRAAAQDGAAQNSGGQDEFSAREADSPVAGFSHDDILRRLRQLSRQAQAQRLADKAEQPAAEPAGGGRLAANDGTVSPFGALPSARAFARDGAAEMTP